MALLAPNKEDTQKIHSEVNQIVNQRLLLTTLAVTVFGAMLAWVIPRNPPLEGSSIGTFVFVAAILLTVILFALFLLTHHLTYMLRVFSTYLDEAGTSNWEKDWATYRTEFSYLGYTKPQAIIFLLLGFLSSIFPFLLWAAYPIKMEPRAGAIITAILGILYVIFVWGMGLSGWFAKEGDIKRKWNSLNKK